MRNKDKDIFSFLNANGKNLISKVEVVYLQFSDIKKMAIITRRLCGIRRSQETDGYAPKEVIKEK